jgi:beta-barrel assembly-enhancing protease
MSAAAPEGRRGFLRSACLHCAGFAGLLAGAPAIAQQPVTPAAPPEPDWRAGRFVRPPIESDEGGLWAMMDREETRLRRSPLAIRDQKLQAYLRDLVCRLGGEHCTDIRVHVVRTPLFNATMAPNGMMQVWSGLLLRVENEAQLAAVLGHELGHYFERHTLDQLRDRRSRAAFAQFLGMFGLVGAIGQIGVLASMFAFSREHEARADRLGMELMQRAGYDGRQAAQIWDNLLGELKVTGGESAGRSNPLFATHPPVATRRDDLLRLAGERPGSAAEAEFRAAIAPLRFGWLQDELRRGQYEESIVLLNRHLARRAEDAELLAIRGEAFRLRAEPGDAERAVADLHRAIAAEQAPAEAFRSLGLVQKQRADAGAATQAFEKYLVAAPEAADGHLIRTYIAELKP